MMFETTVPMSEFSRDPEIRCPKCGHEWIMEDSFERSEGSETECPECSAVLECSSEDIVRYWTWTLKGDGDETA